MNRLEEVQRVVAKSYAERYAAPETLATINADERVTADARAKIAEQPQWNGRRVFGVFVATSIVGFALAFLVSWFNYGQGGYCARLEWDGLVHRSARSWALVKQYCVSEDGVPLIGPYMAKPALVNAVDNPQPEYPKPRRKKR